MEPEWPHRFRRRPPDLPELSAEPTERELARAYATMAAAWYAQWPVLFDALEWIRAMTQQSRADSETAIRLARELEQRWNDFLRAAGAGPTTPPPPEPQVPPMRAKLPSIKKLAETAERLEDIADKLEETTHPRAEETPAARPLTSERVRQIARNVTTEEKVVDLTKEREKVDARIWQIAFYVMSAIMAAIVALLGWALSRAVAHR